MKGLWSSPVNSPLTLLISQISQLVEDVQRLQSTVNKLRDSGSSQVARLEEELSDKTRSLRVMEDKLKAQDDYQEVKRELG